MGVKSIKWWKLQQDDSLQSVGTSTSSIYCQPIPSAPSTSCISQIIPSFLMGDVGNLTPSSQSVVAKFNTLVFWWVFDKIDQYGKYSCICSRCVFVSQPKVTLAFFYFGFFFAGATQSHHNEDLHTIISVSMDLFISSNINRIFSDSAPGLGSSCHKGRRLP